MYNKKYANTKLWPQWNRMGRLALITEGATEKVPNSGVPIDQIYDKNFAFNDRKYIFDNFS
jgi:hypothetical protein